MIIINNKKGNTLLIVVVATFILLSIALYLNSFVINQIKISNDNSKIKTSEYAAESGIERALYLIRKNNITLNNIVQNNSYNSGNLNNRSSYKIVADSVNGGQQIGTINVSTISANTSYSIDITGYTNIRSVKLFWTSNGNEVYNIVVSRYRNGRFVSNSLQRNLNHFYNSPSTINFSVSNNNRYTYRFIITSRNYDSINNQITFYSGRNATGNVINLVPGGGGQRIKSIGNIGNNNKAIISDFLINNTY